MTNPQLHDPRHIESSIRECNRQLTNEIMFEKQWPTLRGVQLRQGIVQAVDSTLRQCSIYLGGDTDVQINGVPVLTSYVPVIGDNVWLLQNGSDLIAIGTVSIAGPNFYAERKTYATGPETTTSASFVQITSGSPSISFTKRWDDTELRLSLLTTCYVSIAAATEVELGINVGGTDKAITSFYFNNVGEHLTMGGEIRHTVGGGPIAGTYTCVPVWRRKSGTGTITRNEGEAMFFAVEEMMQT